MNKRILTWTMVMMLGGLPAFGQSKTGTTIGQFLLIEPSARLAGMGNAGVAASEGLDAVYFNPAVIGLLHSYNVQFTHSAWLADITYDYVAVSLPVGKWGSVALNLTALNSGEIDVRTVAQPLGTGERFSVSDVAIGVGYGRQVTDRFSAGGQVKYVQETIWNTSMTTTVFDLGTLYQVSERGLRIGASLSNFGTKGRFNGRDLSIVYDADPNRYGDNGALPGDVTTEAFAVPTFFRVGVGMPFRLSPQANLQMAVDAFHPSDNTEGMNAGAQLEYAKRFALRAGWQAAFQQDTELGLTLGVGIWGKLDVYGYKVDYGWADHRRLGGTHRLTFGLAF
jgi:putative salt-induced outer membrane protein YdiY